MKGLGPGVPGAVSWLRRFGFAVLTERIRMYAKHKEVCVAVLASLILGQPQAFAKSRSKPAVGVKTPAPAKSKRAVKAPSTEASALVNQPIRSAPKRVVAWSHYYKAITLDGKLHGKSRRWGDASLDVQRAVVSKIVRYARSRRMSADEIALVLAVCRHESGFNPDAAAAISSSSGLSMAIDARRNELCRRLGRSAVDPFDVDMNVAILVEGMRDSLAFAKARLVLAKGSPSALWILSYAHYHDGPGLGSGGAGLATTRVLPWLGKTRKLVES